MTHPSDNPLQRRGERLVESLIGAAERLAGRFDMVPSGAHNPTQEEEVFLWEFSRHNLGFEDPGTGEDEGALRHYWQAYDRHMQEDGATERSCHVKALFDTWPGRASLLGITRDTVDLIAASGPDPRESERWVKIATRIARLVEQRRKERREKGDSDASDQHGRRLEGQGPGPRQPLATGHPGPGEQHGGDEATGPPVGPPGQEAGAALA